MFKIECRNNIRKFVWLCIFQLWELFVNTFPSERLFIEVIGKHVLVRGYADFEYYFSLRKTTAMIFKWHHDVCFKSIPFFKMNHSETESNENLHEQDIELVHRFKDVIEALMFYVETIRKSRISLPVQI